MNGQVKVNENDLNDVFSTFLESGDTVMMHFSLNAVGWIEEDRIL